MIVRLTVLFFPMSHPSAMTQSALTYNQKASDRSFFRGESESYLNLFHSVLESDIFLEK